MRKTKYLANITFDAVSPWIDILAYIMYSVQCSYYSMIQAIHGKLLFGCNMLLDINFKPSYK